MTEPQAPLRTVLGLPWVPTDTLPRGNVQTDPLAVVGWRVSLSRSHHWLLSLSLLPLAWLTAGSTRVQHVAASFWVQKAPQGPHVLSLAPSSGLWRKWPHTWPLSTEPQRLRH